VSLPPGFELRPVTVEDVQDLLAIEKDVSPFPWNARRFGDSIKEHRGYVLDRTGRVDGFVFFHQVLDQAELMNIAVRPDCQGKGLGACLLQFCFDQIANTVRRIYLEVRISNFSAIALYLKFGFQQVGERRGYYVGQGQKEDALVLAYDFQ